MTQFSRRQFLGNASLAAAAAAVSSIPVLGSELRRTVGPNDRLRIATIGVKGRGMDHLNQWLKMADVEVAAICDIDENVIHGAVDLIEKKSGKKPAYYKDLRKLFEDKSIDAVSVATCTTGIRWRASGPSRPGSTPTSRSRSATTSSKAASWSRRARSTRRSSPSARSAAR